MDKTHSHLFGEIPDPSSDIAAFGRMMFIDAQGVYQKFLDMAVHYTKSEVGYFHLFDAHTNEIQLNVWSENVFSQCHTSYESHYPLSKAGIWADSIRIKSPVIHDDYASCTSAKGIPDGHFHITRHLSTPITMDGRIVGILGVGNSAHPYTEKTAANLQTFVDNMWPVAHTKLTSLGIKRDRQVRSFEGLSPYTTLLDMVGAVSRMLEIRDEYTTHHQTNVAYISEQIASNRGMSEFDITGLRLGATVHDIGKVAIPSSILNKPGKLNPAEMALLRTHAQAGAKVFADVVTPWPLVEMIAQHHERMDGSGYPNGVTGDNICVEARILAIADTFDAMASDRPYRFAPGVDAAVEEISDGRSTRYDPYLVDAFLALVKDDPTFGGRYSNAKDRRHAPN